MAKHISARAYNSGNLSINDSTTTALTLDSERYDTGGIHSTVSNTSRLTCPSGGDGQYSIKGCADFAAGTGIRQLLIRLNGTTFIDIVKVAAVSGASTILNVSTDYELAAGDYVELCVWQNSGGPLNVSAAANYSPEFMMTRIG